MYIKRTIHCPFGKEIILSDRALHRVNRKMQFKLYHVPRTDLLTRGKGNMDFGLYKKIVDAVNPVFLTLAQFGEPLLHPKIVEMVRYARNKKWLCA